MHTATQQRTGTIPDCSASETRNERPSPKSFREWLRERLKSPRQTTGAISRKLLIACAIIFLFALAVRALHWQDSYSELAQKGQWMARHARHYKSEALRMLKEGRILFPRGPVDPGDARLILHPPGYSAFIAGIFALSGESDFALTLAQIILDAISVVMIFLIAAEFFDHAVATIAALLASLSPHFARYSLWTSPDTLCVLPILVAVYLTIKAIKRPRVITIIAAGAMIGLSCWLRANALLLAPFFAIAVFLVIERGKRLVYSLALVGSTVLVVSPITIRNWILFHHFIPISISGGENLVLGIADFDRQGRFGMPTSDADVGPKEALWYHRPDYADTPWLPDGVERDQARYIRGYEVIRSNPGWFLGVAAKRAFFMLRSNDVSRTEFPFDTSKVPIVAGEPAVMHVPALSGDTQPVWSGSAAKLLGGESPIIAPRAQVSVDDVSEMLRITGDESEFGNQFASPPIAVRPGTDYLLTLRIVCDQGHAAAKITSSDLRIALASEILGGNVLQPKPNRHKEGENKENALERSALHDRTSTIQMVFGSGNRTEVRFVISNNGESNARTVTDVGRIELFELGDIPYQWTRYPRVIIGGVQRNIFKTNVMLPVIITGLVLLVLARRGRALLLLLAVPAYYLIAHLPLSTEYRYILAIHYFLFIIAAVTLSCGGAAAAPVFRLSLRRLAAKDSRVRRYVSKLTEGAA